MNNRQGYILGFSAVLIYCILQKNREFELVSSIANLFGTLLVPVAISSIICLFSNFNKFGKIFGLTATIVTLIAIFGSNLYKIDQNNNQIIKSTNLESAIIEQKKKINQFNKLVNIQNEKKNLNDLIKNNYYVLNSNSDEIIKKIDKIDYCFHKFERGQDSLIKINIETFGKLKISDKSLKPEEKTEIDNFISKISSYKTGLSFYSFDIYQLLSEMKNLIKLKSKCKNVIKDNRISFYDENCMNNFNTTSEKIQELIEKTNELSLNMDFN